MGSARGLEALQQPETNTGQSVSLSVIVPAFDEEPRLASSLHVIGGYLLSQSYTAEIVVVDDGSRDGTSRVVRELGPSLGVPVCLARYAENRGKGMALKVGFSLARGERLVFTDADLSTPIETLDPLLRELDSGFDVVIGSRKMPGADIAVRQPKLRETLGRIFTVLVRQWIAPVSDVTCGFKGFRGRAGREIFARVRTPGWSFDGEILAIARQLGCRIQEIPVRWEDRAGSKVRVGRDVARSLSGLFWIRVNAMRDLYADPVSNTPALDEIWRSPDVPAASAGHAS